MHETEFDHDRIAGETRDHQYAQDERQWLGREHGQWCHPDCSCNRPYEPDEPRSYQEIVEFLYGPDGEADIMELESRWNALTEEEKSIFENHYTLNDVLTFP